MKKILAVLFVLVAVMSFATTGRLTGFQAPFWAVSDSYNVLQLPNTVFDYTGLGQLEYLDSSGSYYGGMNFKLMDNIAMGLYFHKAGQAYIFNIWNIEFFFPPMDTDGIYSGVLGTYYCFDAITSYKLSDNFLIGLLINYVHSHDNYDESSLTKPNLANGDYDDETKNSAHELNFKLDITLKEFALFNLFDIGLDFGIPMHKYSYTNKVYDTNAWWDYDVETTELNGAGYMGVWTLMKTNIVDFFFKFYNAKLDHNSRFTNDNNYDGNITVAGGDTDEGEETLQNISEIHVGLSKSKKNAKMLYFFAAYLQSISTKWHTKDIDYLNNETDEEYNYNDSELYINFYSGIEYYMKKWLTLRGGFKLECLLSSSYTIEDPDWTANAVTDIYNESDKYSGTPYINIMVGNTFHLGHFDIDLAFYPDNLLNIFIATGNSNSIVAQGSIIYYFK
ncbi:hypothetical protein J7L48_09420 [bacterium]|nr:hypothetical protein [bacterium]